MMSSTVWYWSNSSAATGASRMRQVPPPGITRETIQLAKDHVTAFTKTGGHPAPPRSLFLSYPSPSSPFLVPILAP